MLNEQDDASMASVYAAKSTLRKQMMRVLRGMSDADVERQSSRVADLILDSSHYRDARSIGCYLHMPHAELRTNRIVNAALEDGKNLYIPYLSDISSEGDMRMLRLYSRADLDACKLDKWNLLDPTERRQDVDQPREDAMDADLDMILIPGVAFDEDCNRLGRGKAYYDRFLQAYSSRKATLIALALSPQLLPLGVSIPVTPSDFQLDGIAHPGGLIWRKQDAFSPRSTSA